MAVDVDCPSFLQGVAKAVPHGWVRGIDLQGAGKTLHHGERGATNNHVAMPLWNGLAQVPPRKKVIRVYLQRPNIALVPHEGPTMDEYTAVLGYDRAKTVPCVRVINVKLHCTDKAL